MPFNRTHAGTGAKISEPETFGSFNDIISDRLGKTIRCRELELLFPAYPNNCAADDFPALVRPNLFTCAGLFALNDQELRVAMEMPMVLLA